MTKTGAAPPGWEVGVCGQEGQSQGSQFWEDAGHGCRGHNCRASPGEEAGFSHIPMPLRDQTCGPSLIAEARGILCQNITVQEGTNTPSALFLSARPPSLGGARALQAPHTLAGRSPPA